MACLKYFVYVRCISDILSQGSPVLLRVLVRMAANYEVLSLVFLALSYYGQTCTLGWMSLSSQQEDLRE